MSETAVALGKRIRALRERGELTQEQLAESAELSLKHLGLIERGQANPTLSSLEGLAKAFGLTLPELFELDHERLDGKQLGNKVNELFAAANDTERKLIYRLVQIVLR